MIPKPVYDELSFPTTPHLKRGIDDLINKNIAFLVSIDVGSDAYYLYHTLTTSANNSYKVIGRGEAAAIALAKSNEGILASNNLRDIDIYIHQFQLKHITTADILIDAFEKGLITKDEGDNIWRAMIARRRKLGAASFSEYISYHYKNQQK